MTTFERDVGESNYETGHVNETLFIFLKLGS